MAEETELLRLLPQAVQYVVAVGDQVAPQCQDHRERMFGYRVDGVVTDVGHRYAVCIAVGNIDDGVTGRGRGDQPQLRQLPQSIRAQRHLVGDRDGCTLDPPDNVFRGGSRMLNVRCLAVWLPNVCSKGCSIQKNNPTAHLPLEVRGVVLRCQSSGTAATPL